MKSDVAHFSVLSYSFRIALIFVTGAAYLVFRDLGAHPFFWMMIALDGLLLVAFFLTMFQKPRQLQPQRVTLQISRRQKR